MRIRAVLAVVLAVALLAGCGEGDDEATTAARGAPEIEDPGPVHVHGLGVNPADGALFVATHTGLFRVPADGETAERVAGRYQDTMGFAIVGPDRFLGSGHPDGREGLPPFLGLIRSDDAGQTWREVSLMGKSDFHVLEASGRRIYGFGSNFETKAPEFLVSDDGGRTWDERATPGPLASLAISPEDPDVVVAATEDGLHRSGDGGRTWRPLADDTGLLTWAERGDLYAVSADGLVARSGDAGSSWDRAGSIGGAPAAFEAAGEVLYAALHDGALKVSRDRGKTWNVRAVSAARPAR